MWNNIRVKFRWICNDYRCKNIKTGSIVKENASILTIIPDDINIKANFRKHNFFDIKKGQKVKVEINSCKNKFNGLIEDADYNSKLISTKIKLTDTIRDCSITNKSQIKIIIKFSEFL